ncbi:hypothetical protein M2432_004817 [Mycobacterium sp. OTB74]|nr:TnsA-like heteromeric transposase endonuclease subunit [Mycobacterium sp. OTB74]MDH6247154.1 hypothetical protein [Mycobacterium sp. OTB74]
MPAWNWAAQGHPPLDRLQPTRIPRSSKHNRHIPVTAYSMTNGGYLQLESGLEHDLLRKVDRDPAVEGIVSQPFTLFWRGSEDGHHFPDLLTWKTDGSVTVWDARSPDKQTDKFRRAMTITAPACGAVGWRHEVFPGLGRTERVNLLWLHGFRRRPTRADAVQKRICSAVRYPGATLGDLFDCDDGSGELIAVVWHLIWSGVLTIDMDAHWERETAVALGPELAGS